MNPIPREKSNAVSHGVDTMFATSSRVYNVTSFGANLREGWPSSGRLGEVIATFDHTCYVTGPNGSLICIAGDQADDGPAMLRVDFGNTFDMGGIGVRVGMPASVHRSDLLLGPHIRLRMAGAVAWIPPEASQSAPPATILRCLRALTEDLTPSAPDAGLAPLVRYAEDLAHGREFPMRGQMVGLALPGVSAIVNGLCLGSEPEIERGVRTLIGLGPGLTPSGDDFLGGLIVALKSERRAARGHDSSSGADSDLGIMTSVLADSVVRSAAAGTTRISASLLTYAAKGTGSAGVHRLLELIMGAGARSRCSRAALKVAGAGHTSGWDCLAGLFLGVHISLASGDPQTSGFALARPRAQR